MRVEGNALKLGGGNDKEKVGNDGENKCQAANESVETRLSVAEEARRGSGARASHRFPAICRHDNLTAARFALCTKAITVFVPQGAQLLAVGLADEDIEGRGATVAGEGADGSRGRRNLLAVMQHDRSFR